MLGEGPVWVEREQALYWLDIKGRKVFRIDEQEQLREWPTPVRVGSLAPRADGGFIAGTEDGVAFVELEAGRFEIVHHPEEHLPDNRFNDGKVDRRGRFWAGSMDDTERDATGTLYRVDPDMRFSRIDEGYKVTNGPAFSPSGDILYHNDSARQVTYAFDLASDGTVGERRVFARYGEGEGYPDGMTVDADGCLWIAFWDGWCVRRYSTGGECIGKLDVPVSRPTSCAFGGAALDRLFITSASIGLDEGDLAKEPQAGGLFVAVVDAKGIAERPFAG